MSSLLQCLHLKRAGLLLISHHKLGVLDGEEAEGVREQHRIEWTVHAKWGRALYERFGDSD